MIGSDLPLDLIRVGFKFELTSINSLNFLFTNPTDSLPVRLSPEMIKAKGKFSQGISAANSPGARKSSVREM